MAAGLQDELMRTSMLLTGLELWKRRFRPIKGERARLQFQIKLEALSREEVPGRFSDVVSGGSIAGHPHLLCCSAASLQSGQ